MDEIRERLNQPGRGVNDAVSYYAERNPDVPYSIRSEPILYGELARAALLWTGELLGAVEQAARQRPAAQDSVRAFIDAVSGYFGATTRWPAIPHLRDPLRLLVPAYYAVRAVQLLGFHVQPALVSVDYDEAHDFMEEVLGRRPAMTIRQHKNADLAAMPEVAEEDTGHEPIMFPWLLSGRQRARLEKARAALPPARQAMPTATEPSPAGHAAAGATEEPPAPSPDGELILTALWTRRLGGTRITLRSESSSDSDYSGGS